MKGTKSSGSKGLKDLDYRLLIHFLPHKFSYAQKVRGRMILDSLKNGRLLDAGAGCGWLSRLAKEKGFNVVGIDIADKVIAENKWFDKTTGGTSIDLKKASVYKLPFRDNYFDSLVMSEVLEHLTYPKKALNEAFRVLKRDGKFALLIPGYSYMFVYDALLHPLTKLGFFNYDKRISKKLSKYHLSHKSRFEDSHRFRYTIKSLKKLLVSSGFVIEDIKNSEFLSPFMNTILCNVLGLRREKISSLEKIDTVLMKKVPLFLGSDWLFVCRKKSAKERV